MPFITEWQPTQNRWPLAFACTQSPGLIYVDGTFGAEEWSPNDTFVGGYMAVEPVTTTGGFLSDVAVAPDGHVFAVGTTTSSDIDRLWEFAPGVRTPIRSTQIAGLPSLSSVAVLNDSTLLITGGTRQYWGGLIFECARNGTVRRQWGPAFGIYPFMDLATSPTGDVFLSLLVDRKIWVFSNSGVPLRSWGSEGTGEGQFAGPTQKIAADASGNIYVADSGNNRVQKFTRDGILLCQWGNSGPANSLLPGPGAIAVDAAGRVFVGATSQTNGDRLVKVFQSLPTSTSRHTWGAVKTQKR